MGSANAESNAPVLLAILDGWGLREQREANAVRLAATPVMDRLGRSCPATTLTPCGEAVGLPPGQMGNSEVGHLNIGAGRIVYQDIMRINRAIESEELYENRAFLDLIGGVKRRGGTLHLIGLVSDGGVHSHLDHLLALIRLCRRNGMKDVAIHALTDGRDTSPSGGRAYLATLQKAADAAGARIATVIGRYYAMDRDQRWERTALAWSAMVAGEGAPAPSAAGAIERSYAAGKSDEFVVPAVVQTPTGSPLAPIRDGDGVLLFNFRADRMRQICRAFSEPHFNGFDRGSVPKVDIATMTSYSESYTFPVAFPRERHRNVLGELFGDNGIANLRIAETEKYAHVTYFFNGGVETSFPGEERILIPSPKVETYDQQPEMSAPELTERLVREIRSRTYRAVILNFANPDMVGHTGSIPAAVKAVETVDHCLGRALAALEEVGGTALVTADHGNCETMIDPDTGGPHTAHTTNPVPCLLVGTAGVGALRGGGSLRDLAPTLLGLLGLEKPAEMSGSDLRNAASK